eukprot:TRINITY_DN1123_c0_g1_i1.p1 TRINITY_DN1123_c0_g1~~TRINITY_DN1123_c0_g1_i1.p1  ORF type:complete len:579 (+),score=110.09 TRINITY_DN1123_c0_g1_i1:346-2082(+)
MATPGNEAVQNEGQPQQSLSCLFSTDFLIKNSGEQVKPRDLEGKIVGLYFSAHWCPPCRGFTPLLVDVYNKLASKGDFEVVFVSSDDGEEEFGEYFETMPWLAVPFSDASTKENLGEVFKVEGIPHLVILGKDGHVLTDSGVEIIRDFEADAYPFTKEKLDHLHNEMELAKAEQSFQSLLVTDERDFVISHNNKVPVTELQGKTVGLYFSGHWCGPCRTFTPELVKIYNELRSKGEAFEIVFCSSDKDETSFQEYYATMPWLALPFGDKIKKKLSKYFDISGIPSLIILSPEGKTVQTKAVHLIREYGIRAYPFTEERRQELRAEDNARREAATLECMLACGNKNFVINHEGKQIPVRDLAGKTVALYFSAHWCPPCQNFTPKLVKVYNELKEKGEAFEILFISFDENEKAFKEYYSTMPWLALPFDDEERKADISRVLQVMTIPSLIVAAPGGKFISFDTVSAVSMYGSRAYPFTETSLENLKKEIHDQAMKFQKEVQSNKHEHGLVLTERESFVCDECDELGAVWSYYCKDCDYDLHVECALDQRNDGDQNVADAVADEDKSHKGIVCDGDVCRRV